jgi:2-polyprenyl-3-methyl-5-hydroxy-6-metoxy-1,4-benzoquinol methylase
MNTEHNYLEINRQSWNNRVDSHLKSEFYDMKGFMNGKTSLNDIELKLLGNIKGKSILHLQCHFGQDTISLSRLGADVTGVDLSDKAIESAMQIAKDTNSNAQFICCDIFDLPNHLHKKFDIVFTSYGTIGWLPDLNKWAKIVFEFLKPNGQFVFVEFHPVVWMFDDNFEKITYKYFNSGAIVETESGTYADKQAEITQSYVMWNHGIGEVLNSLIKNSLTINSLEEYDYSPYNCFNKTIEFEPNKYRIEHLGDKIPMVYAISANLMKTQTENNSKQILNKK